MQFAKILETLLESCHVPQRLVKNLAKDIVKLSEKHGLDVSQFGGSRCMSGRPGHLLQVVLLIVWRLVYYGSDHVSFFPLEQIFIKRHLVDKYVYAALPFGVQDKKRMPISKHLASGGPISGQVRICCHPQLFMKANLVG